MIEVGDVATDFAGGVVLVLGFLHLAAETLTREDWLRLRRAPRSASLRGAITVFVALRLTGDEFLRQLAAASWTVGALALLVAPVLIGVYFERRLAVPHPGRCMAPRRRGAWHGAYVGLARSDTPAREALRGVSFPPPQLI